VTELSKSFRVGRRYRLRDVTVTRYPNCSQYKHNNHLGQQMAFCGHPVGDSAIRLLQKRMFQLACLVVLLLGYVGGQSNYRRCYTCRSRGELGDCRDPFMPPEPRQPGLPAPAHTAAIHQLPCSSGWCSKILDGLDKNTVDDLDIATERACMQRAPSDGLERCAYVKYNYKEVFMCFCRGDLCNSSKGLLPGVPLLVGLLFATLLWL